FTTKDTRTFSDGSPFQLLVDDLTTDEIAKVEFQLSPTDANHLWYTMNVLDWPKGDQEGQIQDTDGETFYSLDSTITQSPNDDGDIRLIPMLEIEITGTPDNLPSADVLKDFGISVHQTSSDTQTAYVPLQLVSDKIGEKNVAFYGRMFYEADSSWGNAQQVRLVWLVQALVDKCKTFKNNVCTEYSKKNDVQIIQVYDDDFFLTGLSVTEEQGAKIATIYEDPTVATDEPFYFDTLYKMFYGLDNSYLAGSDCDTTNSAGDCIGDGTLDVTIDEITAWFNHTTNSNVDVNKRWDMENVLSVSTQSYKSIDLGMITTTITTTNQVLTDNFNSYWTPTNLITPTLMYAWQETYRAINMDETITETNTLTWTGNNLKVDMAPNAVSSETLAGVKWTPYAYNGSKWALADIEAFWEQMKKQLAGTFADNEYPETDQAWAQLLYLSVYGASINIVQINDTLVTKEYQLASAPLTAKLSKGGGAGIKKVVGYYFKDTDPDLKGGGGGLKELLGFGSEVQEADGPFAGLNLSLKLMRYISGEEGLYGEATGVVITAAAIAASIALAEQYIHHDTNSKWKTTAAVSVGTIIFYYSVIKPMKTSIELSMALVEIDESTSFGEALFAAMTSSSKLVGASRLAGVIGLIIAIGVAVFVFAYFMASGQVNPGTIAFNELIAQTIAVIILAVILFALSTTVIGSIIVGLITLVDVVAMLLGVGWTISGEATKFLASIIYQFDLTVDVDVDSGKLDMALADEAAGFTDGNSVIYSLPITTTLKQTSPRSQDALKSNSLIYEFSQVDDSYQFNTSLYNRSDEWQITQYDTYYDPNVGPLPLYEATIVDTVTGDVMLSAGVNRKTNLYLDSAYALNGLSCWVGFCSSKTVAGSKSNDIGSAITLDVLPATLDEFVNVSYWSNGALLFLDADGDGLLPTIAGGLDPDDSTWDADGDNLSDAYELTLQSRSQAEGGVFLDPLNPDTDGDGIRDDEEL
ncbi:MAG: hypothetical protein WAM60_09415, partial [Candidatus Promineifilaceae bacterium]